MQDRYAKAGAFAGMACPQPALQQHQKKFSNKFVETCRAAPDAPARLLIGIAA